MWKHYLKRVSFPLLAGFALVVSTPGCGGNGTPAGTSIAAELVARIEDFENEKAWSLSPIGEAAATVAPVAAGDGAALEVRFEIPRPDLNTMKIATGWELKKSDCRFTLAPDQALSLVLWWEGGENFLRVELFDEEGRGRMAEFVHLQETSAWSEILISDRNWEAWGNGPKTGEMGEIRTVNLVYSFSWSDGPGRVLFDEMRVVRMPPPAALIAVSQLGYRPGDRKKAVLRTFQAGAGTHTFQLKSLPSGNVVKEGAFEDAGFSDWEGRHLVADFSDVSLPGRFQIVARAPDKTEISSEPFQIRERIFDDRTARLVLQFLGSLRADDAEIFGYSELGGYRDAGTMLGRYMNTIPHVIYGLSRFVLASEIAREDAGKIYFALDELRYGVESMIAWQKPDGSVVHAIVRDPDFYWHNQFPPDNTFPWKKLDNELSTLTYAAALASAGRALAPYNPDLARRAVAAAEKAYSWSRSHWVPNRSGALGNQLWDAIELYRATARPAYLDDARALAARILPRQFLDFRRSREGICGNFSLSPRSLDFSYQYKLVHSIGLYLGLIELADVLPAHDALHVDVRFALHVFGREYLRRMADLTPYGALAQGLEVDEDGRVAFTYFHPTNGPLGFQGHGLNCDYLALGLVARRLDAMLQLPDLRDVAAGQMQWIFGVNPLGLSMMTGIGGDVGEELDRYLGLAPIPGGIMNGIVGRNGTNPYWAHHWVSGEYWLPQTAYFIAAMGEIENPGFVAREYESTTGAALKVSFEQPPRIEGGSEAALSLIVINDGQTAYTGPVTVRARGSHAWDRTFDVVVASGARTRLEGKLSPTGKVSPLYIFASDSSGIVGELYTIANFPAWEPPPRENLVRWNPERVEASSIQQDDKSYSAAKAFDGSLETRWSSDFSDDQWIECDLGRAVSLRRILLKWEAAYGESYRIQTSLKKGTWETVYEVDDEDGGRDEVVLDPMRSARFVRVQFLRRGTPYGYSIHEIELLSSPGEGAVPAGHE